MSDRPNNGDVSQLPSDPIRSADALSKTLEGPLAPRSPTPNPASAPAPASTVTSPRSAMHEAQRIGRYAVLRQLGEGGMGVVLAAYDEELDRRVAVKLLRDRSAHAEHRIRILREAQAMARVSHPNVVQVYEVGELVEPGSGDSHIFIAMEFIDGATLHDWQQQPGRTWEEILRVYLAAGQGLLAAHESGLVHRDFKPDNVPPARNRPIPIRSEAGCWQLPTEVWAWECGADR